jgi:hypothetical protein
LTAARSAIESRTRDVYRIAKKKRRSYAEDDMAKSDMDKRKDAGPFMPKWLKVKNSYKALKTGTLFKPDITPAIESYDGTLKEYDTLCKERDELNKIVVELLKQGSESGSKIEGKTKEISDVTTKHVASVQKDGEQLRKCAGGKDVDTKEVVDALCDVVTQGEEFIKKRKSLWTDIDSTATENLARYKKARDEYKSKSEALKAKIDKLADTAYKCQTNIGQIVATYCDIARDADHDEIVKGLQSLGNAFYK